MHVSHQIFKREEKLFGADFNVKALHAKSLSDTTENIRELMFTVTKVLETCTISENTF